MIKSLETLGEFLTPLVRPTRPVPFSFSRFFTNYELARARFRKTQRKDQYSLEINSRQYISYDKVVSRLTNCILFFRIVNMNELELILKYKMNDLEAKAFKICLMWQDLCKKEFPNERYLKISTLKDPRKTTLFKYAYKLIRETKGLLNSDKEYYIYILAQLQIMKLMKEGEIHALIEPQILVGDKAWKRWKIWKKKYDKKINEIKDYRDVGLVTSERQIKIELKRTLEFLSKKDYSLIKKEDFERWASTKQISPYYVILSPFAKKFITEFDNELYRPSITPKIEEFFKKEFSHEF